MKKILCLTTSPTVGGNGDALHECDGLIAEAPVYYNCMAAQALLVINRLCCTFAYKSYQVGPKKKIGVFLTCTGSDVEEMKHHVQLIVDLPSIQRLWRPSAQRCLLAAAIGMPAKTQKHILTGRTKLPAGSANNSERMRYHEQLYF